MRVILNNCPKPSLFTGRSDMTLFKGKKPKAVLKSQVKHDTVEISKPAEIKVK